MADPDRFDHDLLTPPEVLGYLRITSRTLYRLLGEGRIPAVRVGRQWRIRRTDLDEWLRCTAPAPGLRNQPEARTAGDGHEQPCVPPAKRGTNVWENRT